MARISIKSPTRPTVTPLICYEIIFPGAVTTNQRPGWLVNVTDDSWFGPWAGPMQHLSDRAGARHRGRSAGCARRQHGHFRHDRSGGPSHRASRSGADGRDRRELAARVTRDHVCAVWRSFPSRCSCWRRLHWHLPKPRARVHSYAGINSFSSMIMPLVFPGKISCDMTKKANPIDAQVGNRVRIRRMLIGMSQEKSGRSSGAHLPAGAEIRKRRQPDRRRAPVRDRAHPGCADRLLL